MDAFHRPNKEQLAASGAQNGYCLGGLYLLNHSFSYVLYLMRSEYLLSEANRFPI